MWDRIKLIVTGDGSLIMTKYFKDGTLKTTMLVPPEQFEINKLTGYLATLPAKEVFDLVSEEDFWGPANLWLGNLSLNEKK